MGGWVPTLDHYTLIKECAVPVGTASSNIEIPVVDLAAAAGESREEVRRTLVRTCEDLGFFKVVNHGVATELMGRLEAEAKSFFELPLAEKEKSGPPDPLGYGSKMIGPNGDVGWVEYLLLHTRPDVISLNSLAAFRIIPDGQSFRAAVDEYVRAVKGVACEVLELMAEELRIEPRDALSSMLRDDKSDSLFRLNHYPPSPPQLQLQLQPPSGSRSQLLGFGEHTDPQLISVLRSNDTSGLQVCLQDGATWFSVPPDPSSFFINVLTNGRFRSVKHRVFADPTRSRVSMIYFGGPPLSQRIAPMEGLMEEGEETLYKDFTWSEYKKSAYNSRLGDCRLALFEKS
ncbi:hypothetical protein SAY87_024231 [Trapa incisa]|uniref:gibberellin 2beta-dioxygenase n=1 Tax=Trapa incisa TaxID=236973 RepID=A0AAN7GJL0_9MYRT|nr:hypothetical protein SAY87_024231 [Trapa incisa]